MPGFREKVVTDGRTNGLTNMGDLIGPNPTKVGGPKIARTMPGGLKIYQENSRNPPFFKEEAWIQQISSRNLRAGYAN